MLGLASSLESRSPVSQASLFTPSHASCTVPKRVDSFAAISTLHSLARRGSLGEYLCAFRLLCNPRQDHPSAALLIEQYRL